jgi:lipid II:glycine glycyltransferase (peptidoglycan interpeptide bridge formation enzyme)
VNPLSEYPFGTFPKYSSSLGIGRLIGMSTPTTIVELSGRDEESLFADCSHACRNLVRKALRSGVTCIQDNGLKGLEDFYRPYEVSFRRSRSEKRPLAFFKTIYERLAEKGLMRVFLALYDGKPIASALLLCYKNALTYYAGGLDYDAHQLSPSNLLIWESLKGARAAGWAWYETGPFFPYLPTDHKMARIGQFKREFGGKPHLLFEGLLVYNWRSYLVRVFLEESKMLIPIWYRKVSRFLHVGREED